MNNPPHPDVAGESLYWCLFAFLVLLCCCIFVQCAQSRRKVQETRKSEDLQAHTSRPPLYRIENLSAVCNGKDGSIEVTWSLHPPDILRNCIISYRKLFDSTTQQKLSFIPSYTLTRDRNNIEPMNTYEIKVWPSNCESASSAVLVHVDWYCQFPGCTRNRRKREEHSYSSFCSSDHAVRFVSWKKPSSVHSYCLYPECTKKACCGNFCSDDHLEKANRQGVCGLVNVDSTSEQYAKLKKKFSRAWCSKKGKLPKISHALEIVNPKLQQRLDNYVSNISWPYNGVEQYYHGTQIKCDMLEYYEPCSSSNCGVCGISKKGFDPERINSRHWQRFGKGFYFAPNSSKAYDYPRATHNSTNTDHHCMLVCDIAPGCKYTLYKNEPSITGPPKGYHSIYGSAKWLWGLWKSPDMNYDELVVFDTEAVRPHFILFLENM